MDNELLQTVRQIHELLALLAEDKVAERDAKQRAKLREIVGSGKKQAATLLMDGSRSQKEIVNESCLSQSKVSTLISDLSHAGLLIGDRKLPKLAISIPANFFEENET
jgi:DNA-binding MarR family transcriptional regulator